MIAGLIEALLGGERVSGSELEGALRLALEGQLSDARLAGLLVALRTRRIDGELLAAGARAVRAHQRPLPVSPTLRPRLIDTCGTGGDRSSTFNVSTAAALVAASCGACVAKHGNRAVSSKSGSADVLEELGVVLELDEASASRLLESVGFSFLFAPRHHAALARVAGVRGALGIRTIFNLLGPLLNPAGARRQLLGVYTPELTRPLADACRSLGSERVLVVHCDGLDELGLHGTTRGHLLMDGRIEPFELDARTLGLERAPLEALAAGDAVASARTIERVLDGTPGPAADVVSLNAGAALFLADVESSIEDGVARASEALVNGSARRTLQRLRGATQIALRAPTRAASREALG